MVEEEAYCFVDMFAKDEVLPDLVVAVTVVTKQMPVEMSVVS